MQPAGNDCPQRQEDRDAAWRRRPPPDAGRPGGKGPTELGGRASTRFLGARIMASLSAFWAIFPRSGFGLGLAVAQNA